MLNMGNQKGQRIRWFGFIIFGGSLLSGCGIQQDNISPEDTVRPVRMLQVAAADTESLRFATVIRSSRSVDLAFSVSGQLMALNVLDGSLVSEGQLLGQLDARDFELRLESAKAAFDLAEADFRRFEQLAQSGAVSAATLDQARAKFLTAKATLEEADKFLQDTNLVAPFSGVVAQRFVEQFANLQAKQPVLRLQAREPLEAVINVSEALILRSRVQEARPREIMASVQFDALPGVSIPAVFKELRPEADPGSQTFQVVFELQVPATVLVLPGMNATLTGLALRHREGNVPVIVPPLTVVSAPDGKNAVWVFNEADGTVQQRFVEVGTLQSGGLEILTGLQPGEWVVTAGLSQMRNGMKVRPL